MRIKTMIERREARAQKGFFPVAPGLILSSSLSLTNWHNFNFSNRTEDFRNKTRLLVVYDCLWAFLASTGQRGAVAQSVAIRIERLWFTPARGYYIVLSSKTLCSLSVSTHLVAIMATDELLGEELLREAYEQANWWVTSLVRYLGFELYYFREGNPAV